MKNEIRKILESTNYEYYGIRGMDYEVQIGETLETSYGWDLDKDVTTYGTDNEEELGGVSVTIAKRDLSKSTPYWGFDEEFETLDEKIEGIINTIEWHERNYSYSNVYLVGSNEEGYGSTNDLNEYILKDAKVLMKIK